MHKLLILAVAVLLISGCLPAGNTEGDPSPEIMTTGMICMYLADAETDSSLAARLCELCGSMGGK